MNSISTTPPAVEKQITEIELCGWIGHAAPGDIFEYHRGFLARDIVPLDNRLSERDQAALVRLARRARWAAEAGLIHLVQRRHGPEDYSYLAVARPKPKTVPVSLSSLLRAEVGMIRVTASVEHASATRARYRAWIGTEHEPRPSLRPFMRARTARPSKPTFRPAFNNQEPR